MRTLETNILDIQFGNIIHFVNCKGVWGAGLAAQIKQRHPKAFEDYLKSLKSYSKPFYALGRVSSYITEDKSKTIISCFTQYDVGVTSRKTEYSAVINSLQEIEGQYRGSIFIPYKVGCGLGGGDWEIVSDIIKKYLPDAIICKHG